MVELLLFDREVTAVLRVDRRLVGGGWVALPLVRFGITRLDTGLTY